MAFGDSIRRQPSHLWAARRPRSSPRSALWHYPRVALPGLRSPGAGARRCCAARRSPWSSSSSPGPRVVRRTLHPVRRPLAVAVDTSRSMGLLGGLERSRLDRVQGFLESGSSAGSRRGSSPGTSRSAESLSPLARDGIGGAPARRAAHRPGRGAAGRRRHREPAALVLFTDGGHGAALGPRRSPRCRTCRW